MIKYREPTYELAAGKKTEPLKVVARSSRFRRGAKVDGWRKSVRLAKDKRQAQEAHMRKRTSAGGSMEAAGAQRFS